MPYGLSSHACSTNLAEQLATFRHGLHTRVGTQASKSVFSKSARSNDRSAFSTDRSVLVYYWFALAVTGGLAPGYSAGVPVGP
jgi:hypothetical protein